MYKTLTKSFTETSAINYLWFVSDEPVYSEKLKKILRARFLCCIIALRCFYFCSLTFVDMVRCLEFRCSNGEIYLYSSSRV